MSSKESNIEYIKLVNQLTNVKAICESLNIDNSNVCSGKTSDENIQKVVDTLKENIKKLVG